MHQETLRLVVDELRQILPGRFLGKVLQISPTAIALDFQLRQTGLLLISVSPASPRLYFTKDVKEVERQSTTPSSFLQALRATLHGATVQDVTKDDGERIVRFNFAAGMETQTLLAQLTGRSANLFLVSADGMIMHALRRPQGEGQKVHTIYSPPPVSAAMVETEDIVERGAFSSYSEAVADYYRQMDQEDAFNASAKKSTDQLTAQIRKLERLKANLRNDLAAQGNAGEHQRLGELLLANVATAKRAGDEVSLIDYFSPDQKTIQVTLDKDQSLQDAAAEAFSKYTKAKRGVEEINRRLAEVESELATLSEKRDALKQVIAARDSEQLAKFSAQETKQATKAEKAKTRIPGTRSYRSSDGYEIIVGRAARDNDNLTFRVARPNDVWLHAGDYPGSHVIVRNSKRQEIPQRTLIEAAQLAAKFSQASNDAKVVIHYTPRKFISKPKGAAPGLVRLSQFKSITVAPAEKVERIL